MQQLPKCPYACSLLFKGAFPCDLFLNISEFCKEENTRKIYVERVRAKPEKCKVLSLY